MNDSSIHPDDFFMPETEKWKAVEEYEGLYQVSDLGRVRSVERIIDRIKKGKVFKMKQKSVLLRPGSYSNGYFFVVLSKKGKTKQFLLHRLVAKHFIPNPLNLPEVNHKEGNKSNNCANSLEWSNRLNNVRHAINTGLINNNGEKNPYAKSISLEKDGQIYTFNTQREAAKFIGTKDVNVSSAKINKTKVKGYKII